MTFQLLKISQYCIKWSTAHYFEGGKYNLTDISSVSWDSKIVSYNTEYLIRTQSTKRQDLTQFFPQSLSSALTVVCT